MVLVFFAAPCAAAGAQQPPDSQPSGGQQANQTQRPKDQPKQPAPPLFPRHSRGLYRNSSGVEVIDATPQAPPLKTDDPAVPDNGEYEVNLMTNFDYAKGNHQADLLVLDANYGILPVIGGFHMPTQIKFELPLSGARESGGPFRTGLGTASFGLKFNFYHDDHRGISVSLYPQVEFPTPGSHGVAKGLSEAGRRCTCRSSSRASSTSSRSSSTARSRNPYTIRRAGRYPSSASDSAAR